MQNDTEDLENRVLILELEMDTVEAEVLILQDDVVELRNQDSLTDLRLTTVEEDVEGSPLLNLLQLQFRLITAISMKLSVH